MAVQAFVRRARLRLEAVRALQHAARGALAGGAAGLALLLATKAVYAWPVVAAAPWLLLGLGALAGALAALSRPRIPLVAAALYLDRRLGTQERIVTLVTRPDNRFADRLARELGPARALPRLPFPREATLVPVALFVLFTAGLLPAAGAAAPAPPPAPITTETAASPGAGDAEAPPEIGEALLRRLERGAAPGAAELDELSEAIERGLHRPEDRREISDALERAAKGDGEASREVAKALRAKQGGRGGGDGAASVPPPAADDGEGLIQAGPYPEAADFLRAYRRALIEEESR